MNEERKRIIEMIPKLMKSMGHNNALGCACCVTAQMIIDEIKRTGKDERVYGSVTINGPHA
jgi:hypothetical protein